MRRPILSLILGVLLAGSAAGDVVYMKNGKAYRGQVTQEGQKVLIKQSLATIAVDMKDVQKIVKSAPPAKPEKDRPIAPTV